MTIVDLDPPRFQSHAPGSPKKHGNSLLLNVLEWIHYCDGSEKQMHDCLGKLGHSPSDIQGGVHECHELGLVEPRAFHWAVDSNPDSIFACQLTPKGHYHLTHLLTWGEYRKRFAPADFESRVPSTAYSSKTPLRAMFTDIVEFLQYLVLAVHEASPHLTEFHLSLPVAVQWYVKYQCRFFSRDTQEVYSPDNPDSDYMIDEGKLLSMLMTPPMDVALGRDRFLTGKYAKDPYSSPHPYRVRLRAASVLKAAASLPFSKLSTLPPERRCDFTIFKEFANEVLKLNGEEEDASA